MMDPSKSWSANFRPSLNECPTRDVDGRDRETSLARKLFRAGNPMAVEHQDGTASTVD